MNVLELLRLNSDGRRPALAWRWNVRAIAVGGFLLCFFAGLVYVNCVWSCYPNDNDLDEVAWLSTHLSLGRAESFANQGYPPGLPVVLHLLTPLVGSFLRAAFLWQALAATASVWFVFRITSNLSCRRWAGVFALGCAAVAGLPVFTSEFADGTSTAIFLGGLAALTARDADRKGFFLFGLAAGLAYLFRTHYLIFIALVPAALVVAGFGIRPTGKACLAFVAGFAATAWPLWLLNTLAYGTPVHAGVSQYNIAFAVVHGAFDWEDYPNTYNRWPLSRILQEQPWALLQNCVDQAAHTFGLKLSLVSGALGAAAMVLIGSRRHRQLLAFSGLLAVLYVGLVIVPTHYTDRAYAPVAMLASVLVACGVSELVSRTRRQRWALLGALVALLFVLYPSELWTRLKSRAHDAKWNTRISRTLVENGMRSSDEVFSNVWSIYNMVDPQFMPFYNYGGWLELDSEYRREQPHPTAATPEEWQQFFTEQGIHFVILRARGHARALALRPPASWRVLYGDKSIAVYALNPRPEPPPPAELPAPPPQ